MINLGLLKKKTNPMKTNYSKSKKNFNQIFLYLNIKSFFKPCDRIKDLEEKLEKKKNDYSNIENDFRVSFKSF
jgi:hypothetical protein